MEQKDRIQRDLYQIKGDVADPSQQTRQRGVMSSINLTAGAEGKPLIYDRVMQRLLTVDVYKLEGEVGWLHLYCPRCENGLRIREDQKDVHYEPNRTPAELLRLFDVDYLCDVLYPGQRPRLEMLGGTLSVEPAIQCTYDFHGSPCNWEVVIDKNLARKP